MSIPNYKDIIELLKKGMTIEAQEKIMQLREAAMELQEENLSFREKVARLEQQVNMSKNLKLRFGVYWLSGDGVPFCPVCYEKDQKLIHLQDGTKFKVQWRCPVFTRFYDREFN